VRYVRIRILLGSACSGRALRWPKSRHCTSCPGESVIFPIQEAFLTSRANISVVIPVYNSEASLRDLMDRLKSVLDAVASKYEVILVNDGSRDKSWDVICEVADRHDWIIGIDLMRNYGQHNALLCGIRAARYETIVTMDDDLQHPPEEIPKLLEKMEEGFDVVYGTLQNGVHGIWRNLASQVTKWTLQTAMGSTIARRASAFRVFRSQVREAFFNYNNPLVSIDVLLTWGTTRFASVQVRHEPRRFGQSNYTLGKLVLHALNMMTGFSTMPLQVASFAGFGFVLFSVGVLIWVIGRYLIQGGSVPGFPFLASVIGIFAGVQLFCIGIIGEYLARMYQRTMDRPVFTIRSSTVRDDLGLPQDSEGKQ
jgi:glycosyltransferase involved in cell wall biosynthesis